MEIKELNKNEGLTTVSLLNLTTGYSAKGNHVVVSRQLQGQLRQGELTCLLGPNGAGKSTLLRTMAGFHKPFAGSIQIMDRKVEGYTSRELARLVSIVLTDNSKIRNLSVEEVVSLGRTPYTGFWGRLTEKDRKIVSKCLRWVGMENLRHRQMETLSDGERQKVMIAKAVAQETPIILLDEPTAFLDYPSKIGMMLLLHRLAKALHKTIFLSTHDLEHALQVADKIWLLDQKKGLVTGSPEDLSLSGQVEDYFVREGMSYDPVREMFDIKHETVRTLHVVGNHQSPHYILLCRALRRNAIEPVDQTEDDDVDIHVSEDGHYVIRQFGQELLQADSIAFVTEEINKVMAQTTLQKLDLADEEDNH